MSGRRRPSRRLWIAALPGTVAAGGTVSWTSPSTLTITGPDGTPVSNAFVRYHYAGSLTNPVQPVTYVARGSAIIRSGANGQAMIPFRLHVRRPLPLSTPPSLHVDCIYVPRLHNAFGPIAAFATSVPGVFATDEGGTRIVVSAVTGTLRPLSSPPILLIHPAHPDDRPCENAHRRKEIRSRAVTGT